MIDFTSAQSDAYERILEQEHSVEYSRAVNAKADELLRKFEREDIEYALMDHSEALLAMVVAEDTLGAGLIVSKALRAYADRIAQRLVE